MIQHNKEYAKMRCHNPLCKYGPDTNCRNPEHGIHPAKYRKKPVVIDAILWTGCNLKEIIGFTGRHPSSGEWTWEEFEKVVATDGLKIFTLEGKMSADVGDFIIKGVEGECYPCKPGIFRKTYELV